MVTVIRISAAGVVTETPVAVVAPLNEHSNNTPKNNVDKDDKNDDGDGRKTAARETAGNNDNEVEMDDIDEHAGVCRDKKDKNKSLGTRRSSRQKRPRDMSDAPDVNDRDDGKKKRHRKQGKKFIDLTDVEQQEPILRPRGKRGSSTSKYVGVSSYLEKWQAYITIDGKQRHIGCYENEEYAAKDYARAVFKYKRGDDGIKRLKSQQRRKAQKKTKTKKKKIDLTGVEVQQPILKPSAKRGASTSKYVVVTFDRSKKKWRAQTSIKDKTSHIGYYDNEDAAAKDYARVCSSTNKKEEIMLIRSKNNKR